MAHTAAEKQRHDPEPLKARARPARYRTLRNQPSRPELRHDAVATLVTLRDHYSARLDNRLDTSHGEKRQAMAKLDRDDLPAIEPPRG